MTFTTLVDVLRWRGLNQPDQRAFTFLIDGDLERPVHLTYGELDRQAQQIAELLRGTGKVSQQPVLLLFPPGLEVISALFGCFYAGAIAVVADSPRRRSFVPAIEAIIEDSGARVGLTGCSADIEPYFGQSDKLREVQWLAWDEMAGGNACPTAEQDGPCVSADSVALLQYTSGSTGAPKGVMVSHSNIVHNCSVIQRQFLQTADSSTVLWLPLSHDMGLVGGVFQPLYSGYPATFMPALSFLQKPARWLQAISALGATTSAAPNFAYELCVRKIAPAQRDSLDLSRWTVAINGAEPVQARTMERFSDFFEACGFRREAFCPSYGLAEATLVVSGEKTGWPPATRSIQSGNEQVSCGRAVENHTVTIVDPELSLPCMAGEVGEIWVAGGSVANGYWNRPEETAAAFGGYLSNSGEGPFLRTGDLGCLVDDRLFITGRLKDVIIVRGVNYSPYAIEQTVEACHPALRPSCGAAFMAQGDSEERLVVIHELERNFVRTVAATEVFEAIRNAVSDEHGLAVQRIALLRTASLPKTLTGKTKRQSCREAYLTGGLNVVAQWSADVVASPISVPVLGAGMHRDEQALRAWLIQKLSQQLNVQAEDLDTGRPLAEYGLDSAAVVGLAGDLEDYLGCELSPTLVYDYPTIDSLCLYLAANAIPAEVSKSAAH